MSELGASLREARESQGISLEQAEEVTRIRRVFLKALEEERFDDLPSAVYARGLIRNYARFLGLDPDEASADYQAATSAPSSSVPHVLDEPLLRRPIGNLRARLFVWLMAILLLALVGWYLYNRFYLGIEPWPIRAAPTTPIPSATTLMSAPTLIQQDTPESTPTRNVQPTQPSLTSHVPVEEPTATALPPEVPTNTIRPVTPTAPTSAPTSPAIVATRRSTTSVPTATRAASATPIQTEGIRVEARASARTYLEVTADGDELFVGFLEQDQEDVWVASRVISIRVGNAAGVELAVNGVEVGPLGEEGEVIVVEYTLDNLPTG